MWRFYHTDQVFSPYFFNNCGRGENLGTSTCQNSVAGVSMDMLPEEYFRSNKASFVPVEFRGNHMTVTKLRGVLPPSVLGILPDLK